MFAIVFEDPPGPGYILIRPLSHGSEGEVYLVYSMDSGEEYVLKDTRSRQLQSIEVRLALNDIFPPNSNIVLSVMPCVSRPMCLLYQYCNGGTLGMFLKEKVGLYSDGKHSEAFMWYIIKEICKILAFTLNGIKDGQDEPPEWDAILNNDLSSMSQFLVHWAEGSDSEFLKIMIGDWGFSIVHKNPVASVRNVLATNEFEKLDTMLLVLKSHFYREDLRKDDFKSEDSPFSCYQKVYQKAHQMAENKCGFHMA